MFFSPAKQRRPVAVKNVERHVFVCWASRVEVETGRYYKTNNTSVPERNAK